MRRALAASLTIIGLVFALLGSAPGAYAQGSSAGEAITGYLATSGCPGTRAPPCFIQWSPTNPMPVSASVSVSASITGFRPTAVGTPVSASNVSSTQSLPAGAQVVATNTSATVGAYCALGATATTSSQLIPPNSWFGFAISGDTQISCITASSTATINTAGGTGLPTGANGGGGSGGGAATIADGADVAEGATTDAAATQGSTGSVSAKLRTVTSQLNTGNTSLAAIATSVAGATPAGANIIGKVGIDQTTPGTTNGVQITATTAVAPVVSAAAESNHVLKASAGSLLSVSTTSGASSGFMLIFDATSAPVDGAVTPKYCIPVAANNFAAATWPIPATFATGITAVFSTTGCFTKTASATAFIAGQVQ